MREFLNERCSKILRILINEENPITIDRISKSLSVSARTVRYDLDLLEEFFKVKENISLKKKARVGIWLECTEKTKKEIKEIVNTTKSYIKPLSVEERKYYIINQLIQASDIVKMENLARELYVSRITVHNDLKYVEEWLQRFKLKLIRKQNFGIRIEGEEHNWRRAASELLSIFKSNEEIKAILSQTQLGNINTRFKYVNYNKIKEIVPQINLSVIEQILSDADEIFQTSLTDEALEGLVIHIAISISRIVNNKDVKLTVNQFDLIKEKNEFSIAKWISNRIFEEFNVKFQDGEVGYIALHLLGSKVQQSARNDVNEDIVKLIDEKLKLFTMNIIEIASGILKCDLSKDEKLFNGLILHLRPAINRMSHGLNLRNPLIKEIKENYPAAFGASWASIAIFEKYYGIHVCEEEIGYIAMHIGAALERNNTDIKAIIVCGSGIGTCQLVNARLCNNIPNFKIIGNYSMFEVEKIDSNEYDIIVATIPDNYLKELNKPIIRISPMVSEEEIKNLKMQIRDIVKCKEPVINIEANELSKIKLFHEDLIFMNISFESKDEAIKYGCEALSKRGFVTEKYYNTVIEREKVISTALVKQVAIPHGLTSEVNSSAIAVIILDKPILWDEDEVQIIFLLALRIDDNKTLKNFFSYFHRVLFDDSLILKIRDIEKGNQLMEVFKDYI